MTRARDIADLAGGGTLLTRQLFTATAGQTTFTPSAGYNPGALEVFMNGLMLLASDYTATNSSTVVLGVAANAGDEVEILTYQINTIGDTVSASNGGTFNSDVIFDDNVLVGKTSADGTGSTGHDIRATGLAYHSVDGGTVKVLNRLTSDGDIVSLRKDGTTVGSIGVNSGDNLYLAGGTGSTKGIYFNDHGMVPADTGGSPLDNGADLGVSNNRWKDLYLSGGVYLGGTGSADKLDDYEEGTFTPTVATGTLSDASGAYTKIGNTVIAYMYMGAFSDRSSGNVVTINNLPFARVNNNTDGSGGSIFSRYCNKIPNATYVSSNSTNVAMYESSTGNYDTVKHADLNSVSAYFFIQVIYKTN